jgi:hypothetical protein
MNGVVLLNWRYGISWERYVASVLFLSTECSKACAIQRFSESNGYVTIDGRRENMRIFWRHNELCSEW